MERPDENSLEDYMSKIIKLTSENVKRLQAVEITPQGNLIVIGGKNEAGKSSVLDSIEYALGGQPDAKMPVRRGEEKAHIVLDLGELVVKRTFSANGNSSLVVTNADGARQLTPQTILDKMVGKLTFDPLAFSRQKPAEQAETLRVLVGLDFAEHDAKQQKLYDERTILNRDVKALQSRLAAMPSHADAPTEEVSVANILSDQQKASEENQANASKRTIAKESAATEARAMDACTGIEREIKRLTDLLDDAKLKLDAQRQVVSIATQDANAAALAAADLMDINLAPFREKVSKVEADNRKMRENKLRSATQLSFRAKEKEADELTKQIDALDSKRKKKTASAKYPIEGLMFEAGGVTFDGIPFDQCSSAKQLRVSVAIGLALNPTLKVLLIRDGSLLDEDSMKLVAEMAAKADAQVWMERVGVDASTSVVIEDGSVKA